eukprot:CAMPEP_0119034052 /NCGR_PEP_ID=MMETSP1177-20130426/1104_1 /TAXON_ID=2985 /ORGANISM="Ochromonas sp, Strain CCMP1899" /LENGTH=430 /DNA_ID=CAMNT_0006991253 /DNA_START=90 /DNA_END=1379 /DNA_ORIENTATION=-
MFGQYAEVVGFVAGTMENVDEDDGKHLGDLDFDLAHLEESQGHSSECKPTSRPKETLSTITSSSNLEAMIVILGQPPFCIEYITQAATKLIGWKSEEIIGLDLVFLQGDGAVGIDVTLFYDVAYTEKEKSARVSGYTKEGLVFSCNMKCSPIYDIEQVYFSKILTNIAVKFTDFKTHSGFSDEFMKTDFLDEIGMPLNRTENAISYRDSDLGALQCKKSPSADFTLASNLISFGTLSSQLQYISTSKTSTAVALADRNGNIISINSTFEGLFGAQMDENKEHDFKPLFGDLTDEVTRLNFPSKDNDTYKEGNITSSPLSSHSHERMPEPKEFIAVLYDKNLKTITCKVIVLPTSTREEVIKDPNTVHFGVCIQELYGEGDHQRSHEFQRSHESPTSHELDVIQSLKYADVLIQKDKVTRKLAHNNSDSSW